MTKNSFLILLLIFVATTHLFAQTKQSSEEKFKNVNCMNCHDLSKYTVKELKKKLKKIQKGKGPYIMLNILNGIKNKDINYLANKYGKKGK